MKITLLTAVSMCALAGCANVPSPSEEYSHPPSGFKFAPNIAGFKRVSLVPRDPDARAVTTGYSGGTSQCPAAITFWVDPVASPPAPGIAAELLQMEDGKRLDQEFSRATREVLDAYPAALLQSTQSGILDGMPARRAMYNIDDRRLEIVVLVARHAWYLRYRVMFPAPCADEASPLITQFFDEWRR
ncbi:MAG TPA: hypothetical protein VM051_00160 [Usitatibacter sp.]|nr:hypothetical protein [Usitatibacter sp.]